MEPIQELLKLFEEREEYRNLLLVNQKSRKLFKKANPYLLLNYDVIQDVQKFFVKQLNVYCKLSENEDLTESLLEALNEEQTLTIQMLQNVSKKISSFITHGNNEELLDAYDNLKIKEEDLTSRINKDTSLEQTNLHQERNKLQEEINNYRKDYPDMMAYAGTLEKYQQYLMVSLLQTQKILTNLPKKNLTKEEGCKLIQNRKDFFLTNMKEVNEDLTKVELEPRLRNYFYSLCNELTYNWHINETEKKIKEVEQKEHEHVYYAVKHITQGKTNDYHLCCAICGEVVLYPAKQIPVSYYVTKSKGLLKHKRDRKAVLTEELARQQKLAEPTLHMIKHTK